MAHRGPDDVGRWLSSSDGVGLAARRLSIIDVSLMGHQPMIDATERAVITYNGEIYNYRELRDTLTASGSVFRSDSDTEVLLNLYLRDGVGMLGRLNGMFAFAIWDLADRELFLARDSVGVKPLYHVETSSGFLFASEMKSALQDERVSRELDPLGVQNYLAFMYSPAPRTMLQAIQKLEPGHAMMVKEGRVRKKWRYEDPPGSEEPDRMMSWDDAVGEVRGCVARAVERQMVADVPVGAFLSGGLDSTSVVAHARRFTGAHRLQCFTIGFRDAASEREGFADDLPYARRAADALDVDLHVVEVGPEMSDELERMIYHLDEPQADPAALDVYFICRLARARGIKVLLSGAGGDDLFAGYRRHRALMMERYWSWLPQRVRDVLAWSAGKIPVNDPSLRRLGRAFRDAGRSGDERLAAYFPWGREDVQRDLYGPWLRERLAATSILDPLLETLSDLPAGTDPLQKMLYLEAKHFLADHNLNYTDKMSMACGVEVRVPLLDPDLVALSWRIPPAWKQKGGTGKWVFRKAMEPLVPREVIDRPKTGFGAPVRRWLTHELKPMVDDVLSVDSLSDRGLFDPHRVRRLVELDRERRIDGSYTVLSLLCIELWCRQFVDRAFPQIRPDH
jgi:asparagine synthase (glutamine-hydrolysing)